VDAALSGPAAVATIVGVSLVTIGWRVRRAPSAAWGGRPDGLLAVALVAVAAALLLGMGRVPSYRHGPFRLYAGDVHGDENSQQLTDPYTFTHVTHGVLLYGALALTAGRAPLMLRALVAVAAESTWEVLENTDAVIRRYRAATIAQGYDGDSVVNSVGDIAAAALGFALAATLPAGATIGLAVALEAILLVWIRDDLALNVLMLLWPLDWVRAWQSSG
jgi:hypothetical protein